MDRPDHVGLAGDGRFHRIDQGRARHALGLAVAQGRQGVGGLARLRDGDGQRSGPQGRLAIAEFRGDLDVDRQVGHLLDQVLAQQAGDIGGAAGDDLDALQLGEVQLAGDRGAGGQGVHIGRYGALAPFGLVVDLLFHEVAVVALLHDRGRGGEHLDRPVGRRAAGVEDLRPVMVDDDVVAVVQIGDAVGERAQRHAVRADEHLAVPIADGQGRAVARAQDHVGVAADQHGQGVGPAQPVQRRLERRQRIEPALQVLVDQVGDHLAVGVAGEHPALGLQFGLQLGEVLDDAVVHHRHTAGDVRVGVAFGRGAVGGPAGVADAGLGAQRLALQHRLQFAQLARRAAALQHAVHLGGDAGAVITPVFEALEALDQATRHGGLADDSDDAAHAVAVPLPFEGVIILDRL